MSVTVELSGGEEKGKDAPLVILVLSVVLGAVGVVLAVVVVASSLGVVVDVVPSARSIVWSDSHDVEQASAEERTHLWS